MGLCPITAVPSPTGSHSGTVTPLQEASAGTAVPGGAGSAVRAGHSLRKIRLLLLAGMSTWKHRAGTQGCTPARGAPQGPAPTILSRRSPLASASSRSSAVSRSPQAGLLREGGVGHTRGQRPRAAPSPGAPPAGGCLQAWLILKDHAGRELPAAAGAGQNGEDRMGPQELPPTSASGCGQSPRCSGG